MHRSRLGIAFGWLTRTFARKKLLPWLYAFFVANLLGFWTVFEAGGTQDGLTARAFFVWVSVFNLFAISVFWSFMADLYGTAQAKRLYGFIAAGGTAGADRSRADRAVRDALVGAKGMLLVSAAFLGVAIVAILRLRAWADRSGAVGTTAEAPIGGSIWAGAHRRRAHAVPPRHLRVPVRLLAAVDVSLKMIKNMIQAIADAYPIFR